MKEIQTIISQLERQQAAIERALAALREIEGIETATARGQERPQKKRSRKRRMSAEGRARIGAATRKRWADKRAAEAASTAKKASTATRRKRKRNISPEGRARIAAAARKMWAAKKSATKKAG